MWLFRRRRAAAPTSTSADPFFSQDGSITLRRMPTDARAVAQFEGRTPTSSEIRRIASRGYGVQLISPPRGTDLSWLERLPGLEQLEIFATSIELSVIEDLHGLEELTLVGVGDDAVDLSRLPRLRSFYGSLEQGASALRNPNVRDILLEDLGPSLLPTVSSTLRRLELASAPAVSRIDPAADDPELEQVSVYGAKRFDARCLAQFPRLRSLHLASIGSLIGVEVLPTLALAELGINGVRSFDDAESLADLPQGVTVSVLGSSRKLLRDVAARSAASWSFS